MTASVMTGSTCTFYALCASAIEPAGADDGKDGDDDGNRKRVLKRRRKKKAPTDSSSSSAEDRNELVVDASAPEKVALPSQVDRINGHYQNRIRQMSTPEKVFSTFATMVSKKNQEQLMTYTDFVEAVLPYDFRNEAAAANMKNQSVRATDNQLEQQDIPEILRMIINKKKFSINLSEFIVITSLLAIPPADFEFVFKIYDVNENHAMDGKEFISLLQHFKQSNTSNYDVTDAQIIKKTNVWKYLFGVDGKKELSMTEFADFLCELRRAILTLEYKRYCGSTDTKMSPRNFAMSLVSYAHHSEVAYFVHRVNRLPKTLFPASQCSITYREFIEFNQCLFHINDIMRALRYYEKGHQSITQQAFRHSVKYITGIELNENLVALMFWVLDKDGNNTLNQKEIKTLLQERFKYGQATDRVFLGGVLKCFAQCISGD